MVSVAFLIVMTNINMLNDVIPKVVMLSSVFIVMLHVKS
jgi:hypothetical protein